MVLLKIMTTIIFDNFIFTINFVIIIYKNIFLQSTKNFRYFYKYRKKYRGQIIVKKIKHKISIFNEVTDA